MEDNPFDPAMIRGERDIYKNEEHTDAVSRIETAALEGRFFILIGRQGTGKTTALDAASVKLTQSSRCRIIRVPAPDTERLKIGHIIDYLAAQLGTKYRGWNNQRKLGQIKDILAQPGSRRVLLVIDDGHALHGMTLISLKRLYDILKPNAGFDHLIGIVILAQEPMFDTLDRIEEVGTHVTSFQMWGLQGANEVAAYITQKLRKIGKTLADFFDGDADVPALIWKYEVALNPQRKTERWIEPRRLHQICKDLMIAAVAAGEKRIGNNHVEIYYSVL